MLRCSAGSWASWMRCAPHGYNIGYNMGAAAGPRSVIFTCTSFPAIRGKPGSRTSLRAGASWWRTRANHAASAGAASLRSLSRSQQLIEERGTRRWPPRDLEDLARGSGFSLGTCERLQERTGVVECARADLVENLPIR